MATFKANNLKEFNQAVAKFAEKQEIGYSTAVRRLALRALREVTVRTPVDTGRARSNWNLSIGKPDPSVNNVGKDNPLNRGAATQQVVSQKLPRTLPYDQIIYITNNVEYVEILEYGSENREAHRMVGHALELIETIVKAGSV